jgi:inner membrane protein
VDPLTHGLASLAVQRAFFPCLTWRVILAIVFAGTIADIDSLSASFGPVAYLHWHRTATHSLLFIAALALAAFLFSWMRHKNAPKDPWTHYVWVAVLAASTLHLLMDSLQSDAIAPLWPFSAKRISFDMSPAIDPWLIIILVSAILIPELLRLISDEIGSRAKRPRGRNGAILGLAFALIYFAMRGFFHGNVIATLEARTIAGEMPHRAAAFPDAASPFLWHSIVETESALHLVTLRTFGSDATYASGVTTLHKPEPSPFLSAAQASPTAISFLQIAKFPKAVVQIEPEGYSVEIQDLKDLATDSNARSIFAKISLDRSAKVVSSELQWQQNSPGP